MFFFTVYSGESAVGKEAIDRVMERLRDYNLLTTKTLEESNRDYKAMRGKGKAKDKLEAKPESSEVPTPEVSTPAENPENGKPNALDTSSLALAVDLAKYNLGKPVVQKGGKLSQLAHQFVY